MNYDNFNSIRKHLILVGYYAYDICNTLCLVTNTQNIAQSLPVYDEHITHSSTWFTAGFSSSFAVGSTVNFWALATAFVLK